MSTSSQRGLCPVDVDFVLMWTISVSFKSHSLQVANAHIWKCPQHHFKLLE